MHVTVVGFFDNGVIDAMEIDTPYHHVGWAYPPPYYPAPYYPAPYYPYYDPGVGIYVGPPTVIIATTGAKAPTFTGDT